MGSTNGFSRTESTFSDVQNDVKGGRHSTKCALCQGSRLLCGKDRCPIIAKYYAKTQVESLLGGTDIEGSSPPGVFIGRMGYPKVNIGPMVAPIQGDTALMDSPERWHDKTIDDIVGYRSQLVRGMYRVGISDVNASNRIVEQVIELGMSRSSSDMEAQFTKRPQGRLSFDSEVQPMGPSAPLKKLDIDTIKIDHKIERAYSDTDLKATEAVKGLYKNNIPVSNLQKAFSVGAFGIGKKRKFVPTRWSITAVDDMLGKDLMSRTKTYPLIDEYRVYYREHLDNRWAVIFMPTSWRYELIEAWYPNTIWNQYGQGVSIFGDHEHYKGRKTYAAIGGCYYAARLAVNEQLEKERRQAGVVILREAHAGYIMPVGVWNVRENVRNAVKTVPRNFNTLQETLAHISGYMDIPIKRWMKTSAILKDLVQQRRLEDFMSAKPVESEVMVSTDGN